MVGRPSEGRAVAEMVAREEVGVELEAGLEGAEQPMTTADSRATSQTDQRRERSQCATVISSA